MSNEAIVKKGEQIKAIDIELEDVNQQMSILKAKVDMLTSDKNRLTKEIVELKQADNKTTNEQLVNKWVSKMKSKYDNKISVKHDDFIQRSYITVSLTVSSWRQVSPQFAVTNNMSESQVKDYLHGVENTIKLFNEMAVQNMFENSNLSYGYIDEHSLHTIILPNDTDLNKFISLHLNDDGLVAERDMTIKDLCRECDMDYHQFSTTYRQRRVRADWIVRLARFFNVELEELILMDIK